MTPFANLYYFLIVIAVTLPLLVAGKFRGPNWPWIIIATVPLLLVQYFKPLEITSGVVVWELVALAAFGVWQWIIVVLLLRRIIPRRGWIAVPLSLVPIVIAKYVPVFASDFHFGFAGISYVTFRSLDVVFSIIDGTLTEVGALDFFAFLFFFPTISSGPIDRFRRFKPQWREVRTSQQFWIDIDAGIALIFRGLLYKFILATWIDRQFVDHARKVPEFFGVVQYAYAYSAYLFFDFAGYSAFAIGVSRWFGIHSPQNFNMPWAARNIRDFWNRWHMSLSFWFRDHVYSRFVLAAVKGKWFRKRETPGNIGYFVSFGCMGVWHGLTWYYILYGFYHAVLFNVFDAFTRWKKKYTGRFESRFWRGAAHVLTVHCIIAGFWLFSGHGWITPEEAAQMKHQDAAKVEAAADPEKQEKPVKAEKPEK